MNLVFIPVFTLFVKLTDSGTVTFKLCRFMNSLSSIDANQFLFVPIRQLEFWCVSYAAVLTVGKNFTASFICEGTVFDL